jgi:predicted glycogen debranching enzyme
MIRFDTEICRNFDAGIGREWLETNGLGGFASSTISGLNTRRYHGLLMAATKPPVGRTLLLSKLEETVILNGKRYELGANRYPGAVYPDGFRYLQEFRLDPFPIFTYCIEDSQLVKTVFMVDGENTTVIEYLWTGGGCELEIRPLIAFRDYHSLTHRNDALNAEVEEAGTRLTIRPYPDLPALHFIHNSDGRELHGEWFLNFEYPLEQERGMEGHEDLYNPFAMRWHLGGDRMGATVIASTEIHDVTHAGGLREREVERRRAAQVAGATGFTADLVAAAGQFIVNRNGGKTVIAGYHWFGDWGRDTMIALPGLALTTGRTQVARDILLTFARYTDRGMLPNRFPESGDQPEYNTVDATLWFFDAVRLFLEHSQSEEFVHEHFYPVLKDIVDWHVHGTRFSIHVDADGLLYCGEPGTQLTWMDARVNGVPVTPRIGKPVEIQALWHNALRIMQDLSRRFGEPDSYREMAEKASESFNAKFWNIDAGCLYDVVNGGQVDASIRPNQIFAVSLPYPMLSTDHERRVIDVVERELLTPLGLRTLSPRDARYCGHYAGPPDSRDAAYHQGTAWAWLMGPFITAYLNVNGRSDETRKRAAQWLEPFREHLLVAGLGQISEIADADAPFTPRGCIAQAWSVAELLRVSVQEGLVI